MIVSLLARALVPQPKKRAAKTSKACSAAGGWLSARAGRLEAMPVTAVTVAVRAQGGEDRLGVRALEEPARSAAGRRHERGRP